MPAQEEIESKIQKIYRILQNPKLTEYDCKNVDVDEMLGIVPTYSGLIVLFEEGEEIEINGKKQKRIVFVGYSGNIRKRVRQYFCDIERNATLKRQIGYAMINAEVQRGNLPPEFLRLW